LEGSFCIDHAKPSRLLAARVIFFIFPFLSSMRTARSVMGVRFSHVPGFFMMRFFKYAYTKITRTKGTLNLENGAARCENVHDRLKVP
jgi:hypothetical protein